MFDLTGRVALVTGAGSAAGIGFACAQALAACGARVAVSATSERIHDRARELGAFAATADLTDAAAAQGLAETVLERFGRIDILVNNAGMTQTGGPAVEGRFATLDAELWRAGLERTLLTAVHLTRAVLPQMVERRDGRIVFVSSVTGPLVAIDGSSAYGTAKAGLHGLMRALAIETGADGVTVNAVAPGWIETEMLAQTAERLGTTMDLLREQFAKEIPLRRMGLPEDIANVVAFLVSEEASYINGETIYVAGGPVGVL